MHTTDEAIIVWNTRALSAVQAEPVTVSLEKCIEMLDDECVKLNTYDVTPDYYQQKNLVKAVLDAAGVKYVS